MSGTALNKRTINSLLKKIDKVKARLSKDRDELRDLIMEFESIAEDANTAIEDLEHAADALSQLL